MRRLAVIAVLFVGAVASPCRAAGVSNQQVEGAIRKAKAFLYSKQQGGHWEHAPHGVYHNDNSPVGGQWGGITALVTYALLAAGENPQDARLVPAIDFLKKADVRGTYALAMRMQVWLLLPPGKEVRELARADLTRMLTMTRSEGNAKGMHDYTALGRSYSHSRSQYAVLGVWAAEQMGLDVPLRYWTEAEAGWVAHQTADGAWTYAAQEDVTVPVTPGMTAAGVATLFVTQDYLRAGAQCNGNVRNPGIDRGVAWLAKHFDRIATDHRYPRDFPFATLYAVERVGVAGGLKYFGQHDWFAKGAGWLLAKQQADGSFGEFEQGSGPLAGPGARVVDAAFATLFLARGRAPVAINKLDYSRPDRAAAWNQRPRDVANAVRWVGRQLEADLNWQVVNLDPPAEELLEAPIVYLSGSGPVTLTDGQAEKLRAYVEMGGLVVANADCSSPAFATSIRELGKRMFPAYAFGELPADHAIYHNLFDASRWKVRPQVQGLSNGARELVLLIQNGDPARLWQTRAVKGREEAWELAANVFRGTFESRESLRFKGETHVVMPDPEKRPTRKLALARLVYDGNWNPEPAGWRRLAAILHNDFDLALQVDAVRPGEGKLAAYKLAHLTGTSKFALDPGAVEEVRAFVRGGGRLIVDAAGGSAEFADSAEGLVATLFPGARPRPLEADHPWYQFNGQPIPIEYRQYARRALVSNLATGRLRVVEVENRLAIVLSREDLSVGLVGQDVDGVIGYTPATATRLVARQALSVPSVAVPAPRSTATAPTPAQGQPPER